MPGNNVETSSDTTLELEGVFIALYMHYIIVKLQLYNAISMLTFNRLELQGWKAYRITSSEYSAAVIWKTTQHALTLTQDFNF